VANNSYVEVDLPEANDLADLTGIKRDLESAREFAVFFKEVRQGKRWEWILTDALTTAILVRYGRAFAKGIRQPLNKFGADIFSKLTAEQLEKHERLRDFRNLHIAHSVSAFEENIPVARYWVERVQAEGISSVECNSISVSAMSVDDADGIIELTSTFLVHVEALIRNEKARLLQLVRSLPLEDVLRGPKLSRQTSGISKAHENRRRF
jgi:hypothetical protein